MIIERFNLSDGLPTPRPRPIEAIRGCFHFIGNSLSTSSFAPRDRVFEALEAYDWKSYVPHFLDEQKDSQFTIKGVDPILGLKRLSFSIKLEIQSKGEIEELHLILVPRDVSRDVTFNEILELGDLPNYRVKSVNTGDQNYGLIKAVRGQRCDSFLDLNETQACIALHQLGRHAAAGTLFVKNDRGPWNYIFDMQTGLPVVYQIDHENAFQTSFDPIRQLSGWGELTLVERILSKTPSHYLEHAFDRGFLDQFNHFRKHPKVLDLVATHQGIQAADEAEMRLSLDPAALLQQSRIDRTRLQNNIFYGSIWGFLDRKHGYPPHARRDIYRERQVLQTAY